VSRVKESDAAAAGDTLIFWHRFRLQPRKRRQTLMQSRARTDRALREAQEVGRGSRAQRGSGSFGNHHYCPQPSITISTTPILWNDDNHMSMHRENS